MRTKINKKQYFFKSPTTVGADINSRSVPREALVSALKQSSSQPNQEKHGFKNCSGKGTMKRSAKCRQPAGAANSLTWNTEPETTVLFGAEELRGKNQVWPLVFPPPTVTTETWEVQYFGEEKPVIWHYNIQIKFPVQVLFSLPDPYSNTRDGPQFSIKL